MSRRPHDVMAVIALLLANAILGGTPTVGAQRSPELEPVPSAGALTETMAARPMLFTEAAAAHGESVRFAARGAGFGVYFTPRSAVFAFSDGESGKGAAFALRFVGGTADPNIVGRQPDRARFSDLRGNQPAKWRTGMATFREIVYEQVWPGIDVVFRGAAGVLKYDFVVSPGADPSAIRVSYPGAEGLRLDGAGNLLITTALGTVTDTRPRSFEVVDGRSRPINSGYALFTGPADQPEVGFRIDGSIDPGATLLIDPGILASSLLGGSATDGAFDCKTDGFGNVYVTGETSSPDFPGTLGPIAAASKDAFVTKLQPDGLGGFNIVYSTLIGGSANDEPRGIALDGALNVYVTGETRSTDFPTVNAFQSALEAGLDAFVSKLSSDGTTLLYSTYFGGGSNDTGKAIAVDGAGNAYIFGNTSSTDLPTASPDPAGPFAPSINGGGAGCSGSDSFVARLDPSASGAASLVYSTYLGGCNDEVFDLFAGGIAVDAAGNAYVTANTQSDDFPTTAGAFDTQRNPGGSDGGFDVFVTKLNTLGSALIYSTFLGGSGYDEAFKIAVDGAGNAYLTGYTDSLDFPVANAIDATGDVFFDAFVTKVDPTGSSLVYSTFLGGTSFDIGLGITVDSAGNAFVVGETCSTDFATREAADETFDTGGGFDGFVTKIRADGSAFVFSTFLGGDGTSEFANGVAVTPDDSQVYAVACNGSDGVVTLLEAVNSVTGSNIPVTPEDLTTGETNVTLTFDQIDAGGSTFVESSGTGAPPPSGFRVGTPPTYYEITTEALSTGNIEVCIDYSGLSFGNEQTLGLFHFEGGVWVDRTSSLDTANDIICAVVASLSPFAIFESNDSDGDGLSDDDEAALGTNPFNPDTDGEGLLDGTEVDSAMGGGCPDPLQADSDGDTLSDGTEVNAGTNPCNADSDGDGLSDEIDPTPTVPGATTGFLEDFARDVADGIRGLDLGLFTGPNDNANRGRRGSLSNRASDAANLIADGDVQGALDALTSLLQKVDGQSPPPDWMSDSTEKTDLSQDVIFLIALLEL